VYPYTAKHLLKAFSYPDNMLLNVNIDQKQQSVASDIPRRGLSLGLLLTISTLFIVSLVMGVVTYFQHSVELSNQYKIHENLLRESLSPLAAKIEKARTIEEIEHDVQQFHLSFSNRGYPSHDVILLGESNDVITTTRTVNALPEDEYAFKSTVPISLQLPGHEQATLVVLKNVTEYKSSIKRQWIFWFIHMAITLATIFLFLYPAIYFLVTKPVKNLVKGVQKMEMGYWGKVPVRSGAWEIRWLAWRFENMISEIRKAIAHLIEAERKAQRLIQLSNIKINNNDPPQLAMLTTSYPKDHTSPIYQDLLRKCKKLESSSPDDPEATNLANRAWQEDSITANRLGFWEIKSRLEDGALKVLEPEAFNILNNQLTEMKEFLQVWAEKQGEELCNALKEKMIPCVRIFHRVKHTAGVWSKMQDKGLTLDEIHDLYAFRVLVPTETDCYAALGVLHQAFKPVVGRFKDYVAHPKQNGYQSLHTCVKPVEGPAFEIQIRSVAMHQHSENGIAAHWVYKKNGENGKSKLSTRSWWKRLWHLHKQ
jgi:ppGpp synthetase/RelA/SpoT-type nucleotidyltranferase